MPRKSVKEQSRLKSVALGFNQLSLQSSRTASRARKIESARQAEFYPKYSTVPQYWSLFITNCYQQDLDNCSRWAFKNAFEMVTGRFMGTVKTPFSSTTFKQICNIDDGEMLYNSITHFKKHLPLMNLHRYATTKHLHPKPPNFSANISANTLPTDPLFLETDNQH